MNPHRVLAMVRRHVYLYRSSWTRLVELVYWPAMELFVWGFLTIYLRGLGPGLPDFVVLFLGGLILWDVLFRSQIGVSLAFLEEIWSRNLSNLFASPLTPLEFVASQIIVALARTVTASLFMALLAALLYHYNLFTMGLPLAAFFVNLLIMGWSIGLLVSALILRFGQGAESLAWAVIFLFQPVAAVFYPVAVLPPWLQPIALATPAAHVFEGMRALLLDGRFDVGHIIGAFVLNIVYLVLGCAGFLGMFRVARRKGLLLQVGE
ncbi:MAG TPA: ABC transporter permease [Nitrospiria bacterium]|nr:ABC transporter permease [Nitrospiria bacterium]